MRHELHVWPIEQEHCDCTEQCSTEDEYDWVSDHEAIWCLLSVKFVEADFQTFVYCTDCLKLAFVVKLLFVSQDAP